MFLFLRNIGFKLNQQFVNANSKYFRNALVLASLGEFSEYEYMTEFLKDAITIKSVSSGKYKTIRNYQVDKYKYDYHYIK